MIDITAFGVKGSSSSISTYNCLIFNNVENQAVVFRQSAQPLAGYRDGYLHLFLLAVSESDAGAGCVAYPFLTAGRYYFFNINGVVAGEDGVDRVFAGDVLYLAARKVELRGECPRISLGKSG